MWHPFPPLLASTAICSAANLPNGSQYTEVSVTLGEGVSDTSFEFLDDRPSAP